MDLTQWNSPADLRLVATGLASRFLAGEHRSSATGHGNDFFDRRAYCPGDDPRLVDWKHFGRTDRLFVRRQQHLGQQQFSLVLDASASMDFASLSSENCLPTKLRYAATMAGALTQIVIRQHDRVGLDIFQKQNCIVHYPPMRHLAATGRIYETLSQVIQKKTAKNCQERFRETSKGIKKMSENFRGNRGFRGGVVVWLGDFLDDLPQLEKSIRHWTHGGRELWVAQILSPDELQLPQKGHWHLRDSETHEEVQTDLQAVGERYQTQIKSHLDQVRHCCHVAGVRHVLIRTDQPLLQSLRRLLSAQSLRSASQ